VNIVLAIIFMQFWAYVGLALATSLAAFVNVALLYRKLSHSYGSLLDSKTLRRLGSAVIASLVMFIGLYLFTHTIWSFPLNGGVVQFGWIALAVGGGIALFFISALILGERELLLRFLRRRNSAS